MPAKIEEALTKPVVACLTAKMTIKTTSAKHRFSREPKSTALLPPPKALTPTLIRLKPMESTTVPVTIDGKNLRSGFKKKPRTASNKPPMSEAPMMAPYATRPPPIDAATELNTPMKPDDVPIIIGTLPPTGPMPNS